MHGFRLKELFFFFFFLFSSETCVYKNAFCFPSKFRSILEEEKESFIVFLLLLLSSLFSLHWRHGMGEACSYRPRRTIDDVAVCVKFALALECVTNTAANRCSFFLLNGDKIKGALWNEVILFKFWCGSFLFAWGGRTFWRGCGPVCGWGVGGGRVYWWW